LAFEALAKKAEAGHKPLLLQSTAEQRIRVPGKCFIGFYTYFNVKFYQKILRFFLYL